MTAETLSLDAELARDTVGRWIRGTTVATLVALRAVEGVLSVCRAKTRTPPVTLCFLRSLGRSPVFADQTLDGLPALDPGGYIDGMSGFVPRRPLLPDLVESVIVVVLRVLGHASPKVLFSVDQQVVEALAAQCSRIPLREGIRPGYRTGVLMIRLPLPVKTSSTPARTCCRGLGSGI